MKKALMHAGLSTVAASTSLLMLATGPAQATPEKIPDVYRQLVTPNRWQLSLKLSSMQVNPVSNLANQAYTREGFVNGRVTAAVTGLIKNKKGQRYGNMSLNKANTTFGLQIGCQIDMSSGTNIGLEGNLTPSNDFNIKPSVDVDGTKGNSVSVSGQVDASDTVQLDRYLTGSIKGTLLPGHISQVKLGEAKVSPNLPMYLSQANTEVKIDSCGGPVLVRMFARLDTSTDLIDNTLYAYARPHWL